MASVMIGIDPHKGSHTAVALDAREQRLGQLRVRASGGRSTGCWSGPGDGRDGPGRSRAPVGWDCCWLNSSSPLGHTCWTCRRGWPPGYGYWTPGRSTRNDDNRQR